MNQSSSIAVVRKGIALWLAAAVLPPVHAFHAAEEGFPYRVDDAEGVAVSPVAPQFLTSADLDAFQKLRGSALASPLPDARAVAKGFIREQLGIDGDAYAVAHFATAEDRSRGVPDHALPLTDALMEAFPDHSRHGFFAGFADAVGGINGGGNASPGVVPLAVGLAHSNDAKGFFAKLGRFLWSRSGPGYIYNTFFAHGSVVETVGEDARQLDEAFGVYRAGGFAAAYASPLRLSRLVERFGAPGAFAELPYVTKLDEALTRYWQANRSHWALLARYEFVRSARHARDTGALNEVQYRLAMRGGAPHVPLTGLLALAQLRSPGTGEAVEARHFDINGYTASDLVRFVAADGSEVMYIPGGDPSFVAAGSERELREWVLAQARDAQKLDALLLHFSVYDGQDGMFWTGVKHGLENLGDGRWQADGAAIDHANALIVGDVFEDMRARTEKRLRDDARMRASTAWEAWRTRIGRAATLLGPLGYIPPLAVPVQVTTGAVGLAMGIEQGIDGRTTEERNGGAGAASTAVLTSVPVGAVFGGMAPGVVGDAPPSGSRPFFATPERVNGRLGYPMGPDRAPGFPTGPVRRLYRSPTGKLALWSPASLAMHTLAQMPRNVEPLSPGMFARGDERFVTMRGRRVASVVADGSGYRLLLKDKLGGPRIVRGRDNVWDLAFTDDNYVRGSVLAQRVDDTYTEYPDALHRAAEILEQFGSSEADLLESPRRELGPLALLALGQGIIETLPARLRYIYAPTWSVREVQLIAPVMAREANRSLAFHGDDGSFQFAALADGTECHADQVPDIAIRLRHHLDSYVPLKNYRPSMPPEWRTVFQIVVAQRHPTRMLEGTFRKRLAAAIEGRSTSPELERLHRQWIDPLGLPEGQREALKELSRLRHAMFDKYRPLSIGQMEQLRRAGAAQREAMLDGERMPRPDFGDGVLLKLADPANKLLPAEMDYLDGLLASIADKHDALLPHGLRHLVVRDPVTPARTGSWSADQWTEGDRHYVRLRHPDGRAQVVETATARAGEREILAPGEGRDRGTGWFLVERDGRWFPEERLREGFALMPSVLDTRSRVQIDVRPPVAAGFDVQLTGFMVKSIPQPLLRMFGTSLASMDLAPDGMVRMIVRDPRSGRVLNYPTQLDVDGATVPYGPAGAVLPAGLASSPRDTHLIMPVLDKAAGAVVDPPDRTRYIGLLHAEQPASAFIETGFADRHIKTLIETRRLRGMLREDTNLAVVGATPEHAFTMVMPVTPETIDLVASGTGRASLLRDLPAGTVIVDPMYGVRASVADYPARIRAVADEWEAEGTQMKRIGSDGVETRESPLDFTERLLHTPVRPNLWNPARDPISERRYAEYMHRRYVLGAAVKYAGLDWLETRNARRDYTGYFAPPYHVMPQWHAPLPSDPPAVTRMHELAEVAIEVGAKPAGPVGPFF